MISNITYSFFIALFFVFLLVKFKNFIQLNDVPNLRSLHKEPVPITGGIGIVLTFLFVLFLNNNFIGEYSYLFLSVLLVFLVGLYDDIFNAHPRLKFFLIFIASLILSFDNIFLTTLGSYFGFEMTLGFFALPFTFFAIMGFTNALNLIDGVDGLAGGVSIVILLTFLQVGNEFNDTLIIVLSATLLGSITGFLLFNWNPAKIFMGDSGSLTIGFVLAVLALLSAKYLHPVVILYFLAVPVIDTLVVMIRRIKYKKSPFVADKTHIHHLLIEFFGSAKQTTIFLMMSQAIFCLLGYVVARHIESYPMGLFPLAMIISFVILTTMAYMLFTTILKNKGELKNQ